MVEREFVPEGVVPFQELEPLSGELSFLVGLELNHTRLRGTAPGGWEVSQPLPKIRG